MAIGIGQQLGGYEITGLLGKGGMGEVYRARDARLRRDVALKVLPDGLSRDADRLSRFQREAQVLAALNHPNIAQVHGFEELAGTRCIIMELVDGETLQERLRRGAIPFAEALRLLAQVAEGLEAAHERGIVHRDLKPANIKISTSGVVKVLDFGLAKSEPTPEAQIDASNSPTLSVAGTREGVILGTAAYMSPEQARGQTIDKRTDIWSFGCVAYEALSGRVAFRGDTVSDTIAAILEREPDWRALPAMPPAAQRVLKRCLAKDRKQRLRDMADVRIELTDAAAVEQGMGDKPSNARWWILAVAAGIMVAVIGGLLGVRFTQRSAETLPTAKIERLTRDSGLTAEPALSPDGRLIAYASDRAGRGDLDIWVQQTSGGTPLRLTDDPADDYMPEFSNDGSQVAFRSDRSNPGIYIAPALGGDARFVAPDGREPRFSPDGTRLAYWSGQWRGTPSVLAAAAFVLPLSGGSPTRLLPDFVMARDPVWSPDGRSLLVLARRDQVSPLADTYDWWWVSLDGSPPVKSGLLDVLDFRDKSDQETLTIGAWTETGVLLASSDSLWQVPFSKSGKVSGPPRRLALGAGQWSNPTISRDGHIAFAAIDSSRVVERVAIANAAAAPVVLYSDIGDPPGRPSETADGSTIVFEQVFPRSREIWTKNMRTGQQRMVSKIESSLGADAVISPDGARIGYTVTDVPDQGTGFVADASGGVPTKICDGCSVHGFLSDNRRVLVVANAVHSIRVVDVVSQRSDEAITVSEGTVGRPHASPDDRWLAFRTVSGTSGKSHLAPLTPGHPPPPAMWHTIEEPTTTGRPAGWAPNSRILYLLLDTDGFRCLWGQQVSDAGQLVGTVFPARHLHYLGVVGVSTSLGNAISDQGFLYGTTRPTGNIWLLSQK